MVGDPQTGLWPMVGLPQGKGGLPYPSTDWWAATTYGAGGLQPRPKLFTNDPEGVDDLSPNPPFFFPCNAGRCSGGETFSCKPGYEGVMCSSCEKDRFYFQGNCDIPCSDIEPRGAVTVFAIIAVILVWTLVNLSAGGLYASPLICATWQVCAYTYCSSVLHHSPLTLYGDSILTGLSASMSGYRTSLHFNMLRHRSEE